MFFVPLERTDKLRPLMAKKKKLVLIEELIEGVFLTAMVYGVLHILP